MPPSVNKNFLKKKNFFIDMTSVGLVYTRVSSVAASVNLTSIFLVVGAARFELTTYGTQNRRATRLRHAPRIISNRANFVIQF